jgi:hypothetical protein
MDIPIIVAKFIVFHFMMLEVILFLCRQITLYFLISEIVFQIV